MFYNDRLARVGLAQGAAAKIQLQTCFLVFRSMTSEAVPPQNRLDILSEVNLTGALDRLGGLRKAESRDEAENGDWRMRTGHAGGRIEGEAEQEAARPLYPPLCSS